MNKSVLDLTSKWKIVVAAFVFLCLFAVPFAGGTATAEAQTVLKVEPGQVTDCTLPVTVSIEGLPQGQAVNGFNLKVAYDPALLQYKGNQSGSFAAGWTWFTPTINNTEGTVEFSAGNFSGNNPPSSGTVLTLTFQVVGNGTAQFTLPKLSLRDSNNTNIALTPQIGQAVLSGCGSTISVVPGQVTDCTLPVTVSIEGLPQGQAVNGFNLKVAYDPALLQYQSNQSGSFAAGWTWFTPTINNTEGTVEFSAGNFSGNNPPSSGTVLTLTFQVVGNGTAQFTLPKLSLRDSNNTNIALTPQIGQAVLSGCPIELPTVVTSDATEVGTGEAVLNGSVTNNGGGEITEYGFYWGTTDNPTTILKVGTTDISGSFSTTLGDLDEETTYYYKAYAVNSKGTGYGEVKSFKTNKSEPVVVEPVVETGDATEIGTGSAVLNGSVTDNGGGEISEYGFYWGTTDNPTTILKVGTTDISGSFSTTLGDLDEETTYYYKAYAVNSAGTGYGEVKSFKTNKSEPVVVEPVVETGDATEIGTGSAVLNGSVTDNGGGEISEYGFYWGTTDNPTTILKVGTTDISGSFSTTLGDLDEETTYYYKAYAVNSKGTGYGEVKSFKTNKSEPVVVEPVVETGDATEIGTGSAVLNGSVTDNGGGEISEYGFYWGTTDNPTTILKVGTTDISGSFSTTLGDLDEETTYYYKAYAVNSKGTGYGEVKSFKTNKSEPVVVEPVVETGDATEIGTGSAVLNGSVTDNGGGEISEYGFYWGTTDNPTTILKVGTTDISGSFSTTLGDLDEETTYYYKAYAVNSKGTGYGEVKSFKTNKSEPVVVEPVVETGEATEIGTGSAVLNGSVTDNGGGEISEYGFYWGTTDNPTTILKVGTTDISGSFSTTLGDLDEETTYYYKAYAVNSKGTGYGEVKSFKTNKSEPVVVEPVVETGEATEIGTGSAVLNGSVTDNGGGEISEYGFYWGTTDNPTTILKVGTTDISGSFSTTLGDLDEETTYYYKAYAVNSKGTGYGEVKSFKTNKSEPVVVEPVVETGEATEIGTGSAVLNGSVTDNGGGEISEYGFYWGTTDNPTTILKVGTTDISGSFSTTLGDLDEETTYYYKAYAVNSKGTGYGEVKSFKTNKSEPVVVEPVVETGDATEIGTGSAVLNGSVTDNGGGEISEYGFYWGTTDNPTTILKVGTTDISGSFSTTLGDLDEETTYYYKAYAVNSKGTGYGEVKSFKTNKSEPVVVEPVVETGDATEIGTGSAVLNGSVTDNGGGEISEYGFYWGTTDNPTTILKVGTTDISGSFSTTLGDLDEETTYYYKAYAVNSAGTGYGEVKSFKTNKSEPVVVEPVVETGDATEIGTGSAVLNGSVTDNGGGEISEYGFYWGTTDNPTTILKVGTTDISGSFSTTLGDLDEETTYYYKAYAVNSKGTGYGEVKSFKTNKSEPVVVEPVVETGEATEIGTGSAVLNGSVTDNGGGEISEYGFYWGTTDNPTTILKVGTTDISGSFSTTLGDLDEETTYYYKAYAVNSKGTGYGEVKSFKTNKSEPVVVEPVVETGEATEIGTGSAVLNGSVTDNGGGEISEYGFYWGTTDNPTTILKVGTTDISGSFSTTLGDLDEETTYYYKAYAVNSKGTGYGEVKSFKTNKSEPVVVEPVVETGEATEIGTGSAVLNGSVTDNGGGEISEYGFYWGTTDNPTTILKVGTTDISGSFSTTLGDLDEETTYYYKAYAVNSKGTGYGEVKSFKTNKSEPVVVEPVVETGDATEIGTGSAVLNGSVTDNGGGEISEYGFYWGTTDNPTTILKVGTTDISGSFSTTLGDLDEETTYYYKAYAVNSKGTGYGEVKSFKTNKSEPVVVEPVVETGEATEIGTGSAVLNGSVTDNGGGEISEYGFYWGTTDNPTTILKVGTTDISGSFSTTLGDLDEETTYYYKAYAVNSKGTGYGEVKSFKTNKSEPVVVEPVVETGEATEIGTGSAVLNGSVTDNGGGEISEYGFYWGTTDNPTTILKVGTTDISGSFSTTLGDLDEETTYYYKAYAVNSKGTGYGEVKSFKTNKSEPVVVEPVVETGEATEIGTGSAVLNGSVTDNGGGEISEYGFYWGTTDNPTTILKVGTTDISGSFSTTLGDLDEETTYYYKAYAVNSKGTGYGEVKSFKTNKSEPVVVEPVVETGEATEIGTGSAVLNGSVTDNGGGEISEYGFYWGTTDNPTTILKVGTTDISGSFSTTLGDLDEETTYYYKAYAVNSKGTGYGEVKSFTTKKSGTVDPPELEVTVELSRTEDVNYARPLGIEGVASESVDWQVIVKNSAGDVMDSFTADGTSFNVEYRPEQTDLPYSAEYTVEVTATPAEGDPVVVTKTFGVTNYSFKAAELNVSASGGSLSVSARVENLEAQAKQVQGILQVTNSAGDVVDLHIGEPVTIESMGSKNLEFSCSDIETPGTYQAQLFLWLQTEDGWIILGDSVATSFTI